MKNRTTSRILILLSIVAAVLLSIFILRKVIPTQAQISYNSCHFGITSSYGDTMIDLSTVGLDSYLNWGVYSYPSVASNIEHIKVLRVGDEKLYWDGTPCARFTYTDTVTVLPTWVSNYPGATWVVGNEPDTTYSCQDSITAEAYAERYFTIATTIRATDEDAKISFGSIVQPTPIRIRYMERAWLRLIELAGSEASASGLIDFWNIHAFILNEDPTPGSWGTGIPPGFEDDHDDKIIITNLEDAYSIDIFKDRIRDFRAWMAGIGERDKPLWITEYGNLYPPEPDHGFYTTPDEVTRDYMIDTFNFLLSDRNENTGLPSDQNRLAQKWFWFSLIHDRAWWGGALYDLLDESQTLVGDAFINYNPPTGEGGIAELIDPDLYFQTDHISVRPISYANPERTLVNYMIDVRAGNKISSDVLTQATVKIYENDILSGEVTGYVARCAGVGTFSVPWNNIQPNTSHTVRLVVEVSPESGTEEYPPDNEHIFTVTPGEPELFFMPLIKR